MYYKMDLNDLAVVLKEIEEGCIPFEFDYTLESNYSNKIDWSALCYNDWDRIDYWEKKLPSGLVDQFPELMDVLHNIVLTRNGKTPLMELEERAKKRENK
jgi:hypothetical protein